MTQSAGQPRNKVGDPLGSQPQARERESGVQVRAGRVLPSQEVSKHGLHSSLMEKVYGVGIEGLGQDPSSGVMEGPAGAGKGQEGGQRDR